MFQSSISFKLIWDKLNLNTDRKEDKETEEGSYYAMYREVKIVKQRISATLIWFLI